MRRLIALAALAACMLLVGPATVADAKPKPKASPLSSISRALPITGTGPGGQGTFEGRYKIRRFGLDNGALVAVGRLTGVLDLATGRQMVRQGGVVMPVDLSQGGSAKASQVSTCRILTLTLGPLDLNLLGLRIQLNQINLRITGQRGAGNLLGNLLCAVAGLLDPPTLGRADQR